MKQGQVTVERVFDALTQWPCDLSDEIKCLGILVHYINDNPLIFGAPVMGNDTDYLLERIAETLSLIEGPVPFRPGDIGCPGLDDFDDREEQG